jgi:hypothetical protein
MRIRCGEDSGDAIPLPFDRLPELPTDERLLGLYPGACNNFNVSSSGTAQVTAGQISIGWCSGGIINPSSALPNGDWPPSDSPTYEMGVFGIGRVGAGVDNEEERIRSAFVDGDKVKPFVFVWFTVSANNGGTAYYFSAPSAFRYLVASSQVSFPMKRAEVDVRVFGWGTVRMWKVYQASLPEPIISLYNSNAIDIIASGFWEYRDENEENPVYDANTGEAKITPIPTDMSLAALES